MVRARLLILGSVVTIFGCLPPTVGPVSVTAAPEVRRIFVEAFGTTANALNARAQLIERIAARERFAVVEQRDSADAVLRGVIGLRTDRSVWPNAVRGFGTLTLESRRSGRPLWRAEYGRWNPTDPALESVPAMALTRTVAFFDHALHAADRHSAALTARQPNGGW